MWQLRRGITRTVLLTRRYAIKLPSLRAYGGGLAGVLWSVSRGILANQSEAEWWRNATPVERRALCPVLRSRLGGVINVYPRCRPYGDESHWSDAEKRWLWPSALASPGALADSGFGDIKPANLGWLGDRLVILDYDMNWNGCPHDRSGVRNARERTRDE